MDDEQIARTSFVNFLCEQEIDSKVFVGRNGIGPFTSFLHGAKLHAKRIALCQECVLWVCMESDHVLLSYQESVLPVNYTPILL